MSHDEFMRRSNNGKLAVFCNDTWRVYMMDVNTGLIHRICLFDSLLKEFRKYGTN